MISVNKPFQSLLDCAKILFIMLEKFKRIFLTALIISLIGLGAFDYLQNIDTNECSMTYMFQNPNLIPVKMPAVIEKKFLNYKLYLYCEEDACPRNENLRFTEPGNIPVLFVTGNADSHKQVRSMASVGIDKSRKSKGPKKNIKFHYFTISFNEELSALYGPILMRQTEFTKICIQHILGLFKNVQPLVKRPTSVLVIGNSMGGVVSRGLMVPMNQDDDFYQKKLIHTIITQATPHLRPVSFFLTSSDFV
jgi:glycosylphosphatidylinositol deacylase